MEPDQKLNDEHPFAAELASLRKAVAQFQDEAHQASLKLQRQSLDISNAHDRVAYFERMNDALETELSALRDNPHPDSLPQSHPAVYQSQQLTLSLRRLSDKLSLTEQALLERTTELAVATGEAAKAKLSEDNAYELASRIRGREEAGKSRELELEMKVKAAEAAAKMSDLVVKEYADLVRSLQGGNRSQNGSAHARSASVAVSPSSGQFPSPLHSLNEGKAGLQRLVAEFSTSTEKLESELARAQGELSVSESKLEAERKALEQSRQDLAKVQYELQQMKLQDNTAAKMVSRYMKFSQKSTDMLQEAIATLKTRHTATTDSLSEQIANLVDQLHFFERQTEKLRAALDEVGGELMKETYGRRREVALRIRMVSREEKLREELEKWVLKAEEALQRNPEDLQSLHETMIGSARQLLDQSFGGSSDASPGTVARIAVAESAVEALTRELERERARRLELTNHLERGEPKKQPDDLMQFQEMQHTEGEVPSRGTPLLLQKPLPPDPKPQVPPLPPVEPPKETSLPPVAVEPIEPSERREQPLVRQSDEDAGAMEELPKPALTAPSESAANLPPVEDEASLSPLSQDVELPTSLPDVPDEDVTSPNASASSPDSDSEESNALPSPAPQSQDVAVATPAPEIVNEPPHQPLEQTLAIESSPATKVEPGGGQVPDGTSDSLEEDEEEVASLLLDQAVPPTASVEVEATASEIVLPPSISDAAVQRDDGTAQPTAHVEPPSPEQAPPTDIPQSQDAAPHTPATHTEEIPTVSVPSLLLTDADVDTKEPIAPISIPESPAELFLKLPPSLPHPLLAELAQTSHRYDELQRGFRDCHRSLETLKETLKSPPAGSQVDPAIIQAAAKRLAEWTEDARVELEIRAADEELVARGYEALLSIPGALASPGLTPLPSARTSALLGDDEDKTPGAHEVEAQVRAFISGEEPTVRKAFLDLSQKLADIEHDIAALKRSMHGEVVQPSPPASSNEAPPSNGWVSWIRSSPSTPSGLNTPPPLGTGAGPVPTFGNVMSSPRLRHSPSLNLQPQQRVVSGASGTDPFASLGLKVPMPSHIQQRAAPTTPQKPRTISSMYMLGLGARSSTGAFASPSPRGAFTPSRSSPFNVASPIPKANTDAVDDDSNDSDIE